MTEPPEPLPPTAPPSAEAPLQLESATPQAAPVYRRLQHYFSGQSDERRRRITLQAQNLMRDLGVIHQLELSQPDHVLPFDVFPRVIAAEEWQLLAQGVAQRLKVWNAFFSDIYGHQEILKTGVVPLQLVYDDPHYLRAAVGLHPPQTLFSHAAAFDLARNAQGQWVVVEDHLSTLAGPAYAMQSRHVLAHVCPELFESIELRSPHDYPAQLLEHLQSHHQGGADPRLVLLAADPDQPAFYEDSLLARHMGVPLVQGADLAVINSRVYLRTIGGLEPIDVIYRRLAEMWLDPLELRGDSPYGLPGLLNCVRKGTVAMVNAIGTSLGHNRALSASLSRMARFYFNETLLLPTIPRLLCSDPDQREIALAQLDQSHILPLSAWSEERDVAHTPQSDEDFRNLEQAILTAPDQYLAEPRLPLDLLPTLLPSGLELRHAGLRLFAWGGQDTPVPAIALTRFAREPNSRLLTSARGGGIKDTWILGEEPLKERTIRISSPQRRLRLNSRIADCLYWLARYQCRAENTTRILRVIEQLQVEDRTSPRAWNALWEALACATGHATNFFKHSTRFKRRNISHYILLDPDNAASVLNCLRHGRRNAQLGREAVSPELWFILNRLYQRLSAAQSTWTNERDTSQIQELEDETLNQLDALSGAAAQNMLRDDAWHFWTMGAFIERALNTLTVTRQVLMKRQDHAAQGPRRDESNLDALLRMLACQYAYRSLFQTRPLFANVAALLLQDPQLPRSVLFCLSSVRAALQAVLSDQFNPLQGPGEDNSPLRLSHQLIYQVEFADLRPFFAQEDQGKTGRLRKWLDQMTQEITDLATLISDHYLSHQNFRMLR